MGQLSLTRATIQSRLGKRHAPRRPRELSGTPTERSFPPRGWRRARGGGASGGTSAGWASQRRWRTKRQAGDEAGYRSITTARQSLPAAPPPGVSFCPINGGYERVQAPERGRVWRARVRDGPDAVDSPVSNLPSRVRPFPLYDEHGCDVPHEGRGRARRRRGEAHDRHDGPVRPLARRVPR